MLRDEDLSAFEKTLGPEDAAQARAIVAMLDTAAGGNPVRPRDVHELVESENRRGATVERVAACKRIGDAWVAYRAAVPLPPQVVEALAAAKENHHGESLLQKPWFRWVNAGMAAVLLIGLRLSAKVCLHSIPSSSSEESASSGPLLYDVTVEPGAVETTLPEGWKPTHMFPSVRSVGAFGLGTAVSREDGTSVILGAPSVADVVGLTKGADDDAIIDAVFEPFKQAAQDHLELAPDWTRSTCESREKGWIVCGGSANGRYEPRPKTAFLHVKRIGKRYLVALFLSSGPDLSKAETADFVSALKI